MNNSTDAVISINPVQLKGFNDVWKEILKQKVRIVYEISKHKEYNFEKLLKEVLPEALDNKSLWEDNYIKTNVSKSSGETSKKKSFKIKKKISNEEYNNINLEVSSKKLANSKPLIKSTGVKKLRLKLK